MFSKLAELPYFNDPFFISKSRSAKSIAYEALWRSMRPIGSLPLREAFLSPGIGQIQSSVMIIERKPDLQGLVHAAGSKIIEQTGPEIVGSNYIGLMPEASRKEAWRTLGAMISRPCGLWELMPVYIGSSIASILEITGLPVIDDKSGKTFIASYLLPCAMTKETMQRSGVSTDAAITYEYLDLGAGVPNL